MILVSIALILILAFVTYKYIISKQLEETISDVAFGKKTQYISKKESQKIVDAINDGNGNIHVEKVEYSYYKRFGTLKNMVDISVFYNSKEEIFKDGDAVHFRVYYKIKDGHAYINKVEQHISPND